MAGWPPVPKRARSQPPPWLHAPPAVPPAWMQNQAQRLDATRQVFGGLTEKRVDEVFPILYTKGTREAVDIAQKIVKDAEAAQADEGQSSQPGQGSFLEPEVEWVQEAQEKDGLVRSHHEANLMQNRFGEDSPTMFNPARHTVVIAGRPVQAIWDCESVMSHQPCAGSQSLIILVAFLSFVPGALVASRVYFCAFT